MNGTPMRRPAASVQLAVMSAPSTSIDEAAAKARRRHETAGEWIAPSRARAARRLPVAATA